MISNVLKQKFLEQETVDLERKKIISPYRFKIKYNFMPKPETREVFEKAVKKWTGIIQHSVDSPIGEDIELDVYLKERDPRVMASAGILMTRNRRPVESVIYLNSLNWDEQLNQPQQDESEAYYTVVHEIGHAIGIGSCSLWTKQTQKYEDGFYFLGENALREYRTIFNNPNLVGVPLEDNGSENTAGSHIEEHDDRMVNGVSHPGMDHELMSGWAEHHTVHEPISNVTLGMLEDIGYTVDYSKGEVFVI